MNLNLEVSETSCCFITAFTSKNKIKNDLKLEEISSDSSLIEWQVRFTNFCLNNILENILIFCLKKSLFLLILFIVSEAQLRQPLLQRNHDWN